jgi:hypothetical protein
MAEGASRAIRPDDDRRGGGVHETRPPRRTDTDPHLELRLQTRKTEFLRFAADFTIAFSNNVAEQAVWMIKSWIRVSGSQ